MLGRAASLIAAGLARRAPRSLSTSRPAHPSLVASPPVPADACPPYPTAQAWLTRQGLADGGRLPPSVVRSLFRARAVRLACPPSPPRRASAATPVPPGAAVLVPASALERAAKKKEARSPPSTAAADAAAAAALGHALKGRLLVYVPAATPGGGFLILDKPAGVAVQGGGGAAAGPTVDVAARAAGLGGTAGGRGHPPTDSGGGDDGAPRLVHRLDAGASGCLALALGRASAARLAEAFRAPSVEERDGGGGARPGAGSVVKTYWALVDGVPYGDLPDPRRGVDGSVGWGPTLDDRPLPLAPHNPGGKGAYAAALAAVRGEAPPPPPRSITWWRLLAARDGWGWLEMRPVTGRKHQLRRVAASPPLGSPIAGDDRYGAVRSPRGRALDAAVRRAGAAGGGGPRLYLHCASLRVTLPGYGAVLARAAAPPHFRAACEWLGWGSLLRAKEAGRASARVWGRRWRASATKQRRG